MAKAISYETPPNPKPDEARQELDRLVENLHQSGVLRLTNDVLRSLPEVSAIMLKGLNNEKSTNAIQNLSLLLMGIGSIPPERFANLMRGVTEAMECMEREAEPEKDTAPGLKAAYKLLKDEELLQGMGPIIAGIKGFSRRIHEPAVQPAAKEYDGKGTSDT